MDVLAHAVHSRMSEFHAGMLLLSFGKGSCLLGNLFMKYIISELIKGSIRHHIILLTIMTCLMIRDVVLAALESHEVVHRKNAVFMESAYI
jgi:hypothetical protein